MKKNIFFYLTHPTITIPALLERCSDRYVIEQQWKKYMDYPLDLDNPTTFCEKLQWLKLYNRKPLYHKLVDKYTVKKWVADLIGAEHVAKCYGVWNSVDEIDFSTLPTTFVLKCTHTSGGLAIVKNKSQINIEEIKEKIEPFLHVSSWYNNFKEWAYKDVPPRIIAEEYMDTLGKETTIEYKITCIHGRVKMITICSGIAHGRSGEWFNDHFDRDGNRLPFAIRTLGGDFYGPKGTELPEPKIVEELINTAEILSKGIPQVRVDLYVHHGRVMFGEMTFYTWAGFMRYEPKEWDYKMGEWLEL